MATDWLKITEAYDYWRKILPEDRILLGNKQDNFWEMGEQGPCGPCSEIHVDMRTAEEKKAVSGASLVNMDHPQVLEVWNLVFMEFNRKADGSLEKLAAQHIDTGMGFERLCMVLQNKTSNYDTDVFMPLINEIEQKTKRYLRQRRSNRPCYAGYRRSRSNSLFCYCRWATTKQYRSGLCYPKNLEKSNPLWIYFFRS